ncbi:MAG TPA: ATP-dependent DNA helicase RecG [Firmicutes bacterium]|nr:ATP-dependent DNA helicase RecG [Bacillota bacterium]
MKPFHFTPRYELLVGDSSGYIKCVWFNQDYLKRIFKKGQKVLLAGRLRMKSRAMYFENPEFEIIENEEDEKLHIGRLTPIYSLTAGITSKMFRKLMFQVVKEYAQYLEDYFPASFLKENNFLSLSETISEIHFPPPKTNFHNLLRSRTIPQIRMIFDDFFFIQLGLAILKRTKIKVEKIREFKVKGGLVEKLREFLPFSLTKAQDRVVKEIFEDMNSKTPMNRLLQGDVGSGKTVVALFGALLAIQNGYQAAFMAPTEILASQHLKTVTELCSGFGIRTIYLEGGLTGKKRATVLNRIAEGEYDLVIGTHSLIQDDVQFKDLGYVVIDEQHRFGVIQRLRLMEKSNNPDILVMTATPIPRSYALVVYGDMDYSVLDEMPPGRPVTKTFVRDGNALSKIFDFIREKVRNGDQAFIVYPLVEESEKMKLRDATNMYEHLKKKIFPEFKLGLIHGKMKKEEKDVIMAEFKKKEINILISTTVIEVGIDVPNATIMLIEHAERFGLAQLHQLRGRIGRGFKKSYCILVRHEEGTDDSKQRLMAMEEIDDGFKIAEIDLEIRGAGEYAGLKQSGNPEFSIANLVRDFDILKQARSVAFKFADKHDFFSNEEYAALRRELRKRWKDNAYLANVM